MERILTPKGRFYRLNFHFFFYNITETLLTTENIEMQQSENICKFVFFGDQFKLHDDVSMRNLHVLFLNCLDKLLGVIDFAS